MFNFYKVFETSAPSISHQKAGFSDSLLAVHVCYTVTFGEVSLYRESTAQIVPQLKSIFPDSQLCVMISLKYCDIIGSVHISYLQKNQNSFWRNMYLFSILL